MRILLGCKPHEKEWWKSRCRRIQQILWKTMPQTTVLLTITGATERDDGC